MLAGVGLAPRIMYYFHERAALLEWEAQVCLMSQRIPASAGLVREREKKRDHQFTLSADILCAQRNLIFLKERKDEFWPSLFAAENEIDVECRESMIFFNRYLTFSWPFVLVAVMQVCTELLR
jgi:hypothetical protein